MRCRPSLPLLLTGLLAACSTPPGTAPSLAPRAAEQIDPRVPIEVPVSTAPADPALAGRLAELIAEARAGDAAFAATAARAEQRAVAAGDRQSESWVAAQQALSEAVAARAPTTRALAEIDAAGARLLAERGGLSPADLAAIREAGAEVGAIDRRQAERIDRLHARLGG